MLCLVLYTRIHSILMVVAGESQSRPLDPYCYTILLLLLLLLLASSWHSSHPIFSLEPSSRRGSYFNKTISSSCIIVNSCSQHVCIYCNYLFRWDFVLMISLDVWNHQKLEKQVIDLNVERNCLRINTKIIVNPYLMMTFFFFQGFSLEYFFYNMQRFHIVNVSWLLLQKGHWTYGWLRTKPFSLK